MINLDLYLQEPLGSINMIHLKFPHLKITIATLQ